jgi:hypothetical protein
MAGFSSRKAASFKAKSPNKKIEKRGGKYFVEDKAAVARYKLLKEKGIINFKYDLRKQLTRSQEKRITRYWDEFADILNNSTGTAITKRTQNPAKNRAYAEFTGQNKYLRGANFVHAAYSKEKPARLTYDKKTGKAKLKFLGATIEQVFFDQKKLASQGMDYAAPIIKKITSRKGINQSYAIMTAQHEIKRSFGPFELERAVSKLLSEYRPGGEKYVEYGAGNSNHWKNWGINGIRFIGFAEAGNARAKQISEKDEENRRRYQRNAKRDARRKK